MCEAPLAAGVLNDVSGGVALVLVLSITAAGRVCQVLSTAAEDAPHQILEQVTSEEHVDPGVTAAVETGQQHGYNKGHVWVEKQRESYVWYSILEF